MHQASSDETIKMHQASSDGTSKMNQASSDETSKMHQASSDETSDMHDPFDAVATASVTPTKEGAMKNAFLMQKVNEQLGEQEAKATTIDKRMKSGIMPPANWPSKIQ